MNAKILNKDFQHPADGWYQIEAKGNHPNRAAKVVQVIDDTAAESIVNRFNADAAAGQLRHGNEMLIDHEHFSDQADQETRAYGWLTRLENRADGIYGQIRWTSTGKPAVDGGDYRFFSTEYDPESVKILNANQPPPKKDFRHVRPLRLDGLTLTNMHNNRGQRPITNRKSTFAGDVPADSTQSTETKSQNKKMKTVCTLLGLSADADESSVHAAVSKLLNRGDATPVELTQLRNRADITADGLKALRDENTALLDEQIAADLATHKVTDEKIINRVTPLLKGMKNRADRVAFLADCIKPAGSAAPNVRVLNRQDGKGDKSTTTTDASTITPTQLNAEVRKIMNRDGIKDFTAGFNALAAERPELFARQ